MLFFYKENFYRSKQMQSIIEEILNGNCGQAEKMDYGEEYKRLCNKGLEIYNKFYPTLTNEQKKQFDEIYEAESGQSAEAELVFYTKGFKTGFLIAVECFMK